MMKQIGTAITFLVLPVILFAAIYLGITFFGRTIETPSEKMEQIMPSYDESTNTCGNGICEKTERNDQYCAEDC